MNQSKDVFLSGEDCALPKKLKIAFVGGAYDSAVGRAHRAAIALDQRFELIAGCFSRTEQTSRASAVQYGISPERAYDSIDKLLSREASELDAVVIMTPQDQHGQHVIACLESGLPVVCEKALVGSTEEAVAIQSALSSRRGFLAVTYNYTGYPILRELRQMIQKGRLGRVQQIQVEMPQEGFLKRGSNDLPLTPQDWRLRDGSIPTISLDLGVHIHGMIRFLTGETPQEVVATSQSYGNFSQVTDNVACLANYTNGMTCNIWYSKTALGCRNGLKIRVFGEKGSAEWVQENPEFLYMADQKGGRFIVDRTGNDIEIANQPRYTRFKGGHPAGFIEAFANYYCDIADALEQYLQGKSDPESGYVYGISESIEGLQMLEAISRSSQSKQWEKIA